MSACPCALPIDRIFGPIELEMERIEKEKSYKQMSTGSKKKSASFLNMVISSRQTYENERKFYRALDGIDSPESAGNMIFTPSRKCSSIEGEEKTRNDINNYLINYAGMTNMVSAEKNNENTKKNNFRMITMEKDEHKKYNKIEHKIEKKSMNGSDDEYEMIYDT